MQLKYSILDHQAVRELWLGSRQFSTQIHRSLQIQPLPDQHRELPTLEKENLTWFTSLNRNLFYYRRCNSRMLFAFHIVINKMRFKKCKLTVSVDFHLLLIHLHLPLPQQCNVLSKERVYLALKFEISSYHESKILFSLSYALDSYSKMYIPYIHWWIWGSWQ